MTIRTRSFLSTLFVAVAIFSLRISSAQAQWTVVKSFGVEVESVYFLDQQGAPTTGFAGLANSSIWRTMDNGATWSLMATPYQPSVVQVTDFTFSNKLLGWCSVRSYFGDWGQIWRTTNGGASWDSVYTGGAFASVAYCPGTGIVVAPAWTDSSVLSKDSGATWKAFAPAWQNGATFSGLEGVVSNLSAPNPLYTSDGGITWNSPLSLLFDTVEVWAPHAIPGTTTFVAAAEKTRQFFISSDGGANWTNPYTFPIPPFITPPAYLTGCIRGTLANLFVQTSSMGFYFSSDTGKTWDRICGPNNNRDTRFYSIGKAIFAGDYNGNMWYTPDGTVNANPTLGIERSSFNFYGVRCGSDDSVLHFFYGAGCDTAVLTKAQILTGAPAFSVGALSLPTFFSGIDSVNILYTPSSALHDTGTLKLEFVLGTTLFDTVIHLYGTAQSTPSFTHIASLQLSTPYACMASDSSIVIHNLSCDTLTITSATITNKSIFQLPPFSLPNKIPPLDSTTILISASSTHDGTFSAVLALSMLSAGSIKVTDSIPITLKVLQGAEALFGALDLPLLNACDAIDTVFPIMNSECDSIVLLSATLSDTSIFHLGAHTFPESIKASGEVDLPIHIEPGSKGIDSTLLHLHYRSGQTIIDTSITLTIQVLYDLPLHIDLSSNAFNLGNAYVPCQMASRWITFHNGLCHDLTIEQLSWVGANSQFSFDPMALPDTLASDTGVDSVLVHFTPTLATTESNQLRVTLDLDGRETDTILTFSGTGVLAYRDTLLTPVLQYDSIAECLSSERDGEIINLSCDSVITTSALITGASGYSVIGPAFPTMLNHGDTLRVQFLLQPKQTGLASDMAYIKMHDLRNDSDYTDTIALTGYVLAGRHALSLNSSEFSLPSIAPCSVLDSFLVVTNRGCDDVIINDTSLAGYPGIQFLIGLSLPLTIAPDSSVRIPFRILPNRDSLETTVIGLQGQNIDITINFTYAALPGAPALTLFAPDSVFATRPCAPVSKMFWIANSGCDSLVIDSLAIREMPGASQFSFQNVPEMPTVLGIGDTLRFAIQFDPNGNGNELATLVVKSLGAKFSRAIGLTGTVSGAVPTARIALEASDGSLQCSGMASQLTGVVAKLLDDIGDSTALSTVTITLRTNWNLLTPWYFSPAPGWSVLDTITLSDGDFQIRIRHDAKGAVAAGTVLVTCSLYITVSDSTGCDIGISNLRFNDDSAYYENCVLASVAMPETVRFTEIDTCGTPELRGSMEGRLALRIISVVPNPTTIMGGAAQINVMFSIAHAGNVRIIVRDVIGREYLHTALPFLSGSNTVHLQIPGAAEGTYFIQLETEGQVVEANAVVQNVGANLSK